MKKHTHVLILGGGYVGNAMYEHFESDDTSCISADILSRTHYNSIDYTKPTLLKQWIRQWAKYKPSEPKRPDIIINACGYTGRPNVDACEKDRDSTWYYNVVAAKNIQDVGDELGMKVIHVSSGCIYTGYDKTYTEDDEPNFGLFDDASWYSKTKHAGEMMLKDNKNAYILRIRMPFSSTLHDRSIITKLKYYDKVIDQVNSMTCLEDFVLFVDHLIRKIQDKDFYAHPGVYNVVNPHPLSTHEILERMRHYGVENPKWEKITLTDLAFMTNAPRSNCVLSDKKIQHHYRYQLPTTVLSLERCLENITNDKSVERLSK